MSSTPYLRDAHLAAAHATTSKKNPVNPKIRQILIQTISPIPAKRIYHPVTADLQSAASTLALFHPPSQTHRGKPDKHHIMAVVFRDVMFVSMIDVFCGAHSGPQMNQGVTG